MQIILSDEDIVKLVYNAFVDGGLTELGHCDVELKYHDSDYKHAKEVLKANDRKGDTICYEDVLVQMFKDGKLRFTDHNDKKKYDFTPAFVNNNLNALLEDIQSDNDAFNVSDLQESLSDDGNADAWTHFNILQLMLFKELVYG